MKSKHRAHQPSPGRNPPGRDEVARRAYERYQARGRESGHELEDWLQAERELNEQSRAIERR